MRFCCCCTNRIFCLFFKLILSLLYFIHLNMVSKHNDPLKAALGTAFMAFVLFFAIPSLTRRCARFMFRLGQEEEEEEGKGKENLSRQKKAMKSP